MNTSVQFGIIRFLVLQLDIKRDKDFYNIFQRMSQRNRNFEDP